MARSRPAVEHIFSELYDLPESIRAGYCKVKVLELLLFLSALDVEENEEPGHVISRPRMELAQEVARYLGEHMESRVTLEMLSKRFHASGTSIKSSFKAVYGVSLYSYCLLYTSHQADHQRQGGQVIPLTLHFSSPSIAY